MSRKRIDRTGWCFGEWMIIREVSRNDFGAPIYLCRCSCGDEHKVQYSNLVSGKSPRCFACGHIRKRKYAEGSSIDGHRIVKREADRWMIQCEACGFMRWRAPRSSTLGCPRCRNYKLDSHGTMIAFNGETHNIAGWARRIGITREGLRLRLLRMSVRDALTLPRAA